MASVRIDEPARMNVLGLFVASALRRHDADVPLRGAIGIDADGMRVTVSFEDAQVVVTRREMPTRARLKAPLSVLVSALTRPRFGTLFKIKVKGSRLFALRVLPYFKP